MEGSYADLIDSFTIKTKPDKKRKTKCATKHTKTAKIATEFLKKSFEEPKTVFVSNEALFEKIKNAKKSNFRLNQLILTDTDENLKKETDEIPPDDIKSREAFLESVIKEATNDFLRADFWKDQKNAKMRAFSSIEDSAEKEEGLFIGFVRVEGDGRLNKQSCVLQGCREISAGAKVKLDFTRHQHADAMSLFPGKV